MKNLKIWKRSGVAFAATVMLFCLIATVSTIGEAATVVTAATAHYCNLMGEMSSSQGIGQAEVDGMIANLDDPDALAAMGLTPKDSYVEDAPYIFYLTEDVSWEGEFTAPEGIVIAICKNGYTVTGSVNNTDTTGGIYYFQCALLHDCQEKNETMPSFDQEYFDLMQKIFETTETGEIDADMIAALCGDVTLDEDFVLSSAAKLTICTNGYTLTGAENATKNGGTLELIDCSKLHNCYYFGASAQGIGQADVDALLLAERTPEAWGMTASSNPYMVYLYEDVEWEGTLCAPDGVRIALCLNGHTATGDIDNTATTDGGIYTMQCGLHACLIAGESIMTVSSGYIALMEDVMAAQGSVVGFESGILIALYDDITLTKSSVWALEATALINFCTCGHTITNLEYMTANGATVNLIDCSNIGAHACEGLDYEEAEYIMESNFSTMVDPSSGVLMGDPYQTLCLLGDIKLEKTLIIPSGMSVKLCLNGFTLTSPQLIWGKQDSSSGTTQNVCCTAVQVMEGASLTVCDCSEHQTGKIVTDLNDAQGWGVLAASAIQNMGTLTIKGGNFVGMMAILNAGEMTMEDGSIIGLLAAVAQGEELIEGVAASESPNVVMNGGEIHSAGIGVVAMTGDITVNDGTITTQIIGIGTSLNSGDVTGTANIYLNGGTINTGTVDFDAYIRSGLPVEEDGDLSISSADDCIGVSSNSTLVIGGDVEINVAGFAADAADFKADIQLGDGATMTKAEGATVKTVYEVSVNESGASAVIDPSISDNVVPAAVSMATTGENGELIIVPNDGTFVATASVYGCSLSLSGAIVVNFYVTAEQAFIDDENARVIIMYRGEKMEYTISDAVKQDEHYIFSVKVAAKDYQKYVNCYFSDGTNIWAGGAITVNRYLNTLINDTTGTYEAVKDLALKMQNYCMAASYHFEEALEYTPVESLTTEISAVDETALSAYAATQTGESENIRFGGVSLFLQAETTIRFYFYLNDGVTLSDVTLTVDGAEIEATKSGNAYYIDIKNIRAQSLGTAYQVNLDGLQIEYSAISYAYTVLRMGTGSFTQDTVDVVRGLYLYYLAANEYFNGGTENE